MNGPRPHPNWLQGWAAPLFIPWSMVFFSAVFYTHIGWWPPLEIRVLHVIGTALMSAALFALARPWEYRRPD